MRNFLIAFVIFLLWSVLGIWFYACKIKSLCNNAIVETKKTHPTEIIVEPTPDPKIAESSSNIVVDSLQGLFLINPLSVAVTEIDNQFNYKKIVFDYLNTHQNEELIVVGYYNKEETDSIGLVRSANVKKLLVDFGINADKISTSSKLKDFSFNGKGSYHDGIGLEYKMLSEGRLLEIEKGIANKFLYSNFASESFKPDNTLAAYALELKNYIEKYPQKNITIIGHTDNVGEEVDNEWIGMERAKNVRRYLISQGILQDKINASSKGESSPVADNSTKEGRQKNRRIEIKVN